MEKPIPFKRVYVNGFIYDQSGSDTPGQDGRLPNDTIGNTSQLPNNPPGLDLSETVFFDTSVKRTENSQGSVKCIADIEKKWFGSSGYKTFRYQHTITSPQLRANEMWFAFSVMFSEDYVPDGRTNLMFNLGGVGGGAFSFREADGNFIVNFSRGDENTTTNRLLGVLGPTTSGEWHDFLIYARWSPLTEEGRLTIWKDGALARLHHPVTRETWEVVTSQTTGVQNQYTAYPAKGQFVKKVVEGVKTIDLFDWEGFTLGKGVGGDPLDHDFRTGWYYSGWNSQINPTTGETLPGTYIEGDPLYVPPSLRTRTMWTAEVGWQPVDSPMGTLSHDTIFKSLDPEGRTPSLEEIPDWYVPDEEIDPVSIVSPDNDSNFQLGQDIEIHTDADDGEVDLLVNEKVFETKSQPPYNFIIEAGTIDINDSLLNLKFNGNLKDDSFQNNIINLINTQNASYVEGARGEGILLEEGDVWQEDSYISVSPSTELLNLNGPFTVAYWLKGEPGRAHQLFGNRATGGTGIHAYTLSDGRTDFFIYTEEATYTLRSINAGQNTRLNGEWGHFTWVFDGDWLLCLFNGEQTNAVQIGQIDFPSSSQEFRINRTASGNSRANLAWDDFRVYDYAVTDIESLTTDNFLGPITFQVRRAGVTSEPVTINIVEELPTFTITATATTGGNVSGDGEYEENEEVTLTATPDSGYEFVRWEEDSETVSTANPYIFNAEENRILIAVFQETEYQLTVTYTAGGTATGSGEYISGSQVQLTATPNSGYNFVGWYRDGAILSDSNPYNYTTRGQSDTVQAVFELIPIPEYTITVIPSTGGTVTGGGAYEEGQSVTLSAMPHSGWTFVKWSNDATDNPYSFTASENLTISAIFEEVNPEVPYIIVKGKFKIV